MRYTPGQLMTASTAMSVNRCANLVLHRLDLGRVKGSSSQSEIGQLDMSRRIDQEVLSQRPPSCQPQKFYGFAASHTKPPDLPLVSDLGEYIRACEARLRP
jgi:hypothetical protein